MLIDSVHIDRLRVNLVAQFHTENTALLAANEISAIIESYPREMTSQVRQWFTEQQKGRPRDELSSFQQYIQDLEDQLEESNAVPLKVSASRHVVVVVVQLSSSVRRFTNSWRIDRQCLRLSLRRTSNAFSE